MSLLSLQRRMARAVMAPLTPSERMRRVAPNGRPMRAFAGQFIKPNDRLTSFERLEIYNRQYWFRVLSCLNEDFPGLRAVLGDRGFEKMAKAYLTDCPSRSFTLRDLGSRLEGWLRKHSRWAGSRLALALDMVRVEWADIEAFDEQAEPPLLPEDVAKGGGLDLHLRLQPYVRVLALRYPVDDLLLEVKHEENSYFASNAFSERRKRKRVQAVARLKPSEVFLAVHRVDDSVYFRRLEREEFGLLNAIRKGKTLHQAIESGFRRSKIPVAERPARVEAWFRTWATLGWFCRHDTIPQKP
ncbi:MAG TPA: putative DNA-binding domain-containing protein [Candidatus Acidoferrales bacterium]|nr:putative DNA-binding domain-containing protein [Candidatus Acidoferrales bacterium]